MMPRWTTSPGCRSPSCTPARQASVRRSGTPTNGHYRRESNTSGASYNPNTYGQISPPAHQQYFSPPPTTQSHQMPATTMYGQQQQQQNQFGGGPAGQGMPPGWQPPPPPPGPPPSQDYSAMQTAQYPSGTGGYASDPRRPSQGSAQQDPWAGLSAWR